MNRSEKWDKEKQSPKINDEFFENLGYETVSHFKSSDLEPPCESCGFQALGSIYVKWFETHGGLCRVCYENS